MAILWEPEGGHLLKFQKPTKKTPNKQQLRVFVGKMEAS